MPGPQDETYARHLAVVLVAVLEPADNQNASAVEQANTSIVDALRRAGGEAEPLGAERVVATFEAPIGAVEAGLGALASMAADPGLAGVAVRIGCHAADVVTSSEGQGLEPAIAAASRLAARAPAGSMCVERAIAQSVEGTRGIIVRDLGTPSPDEPHAYLVFARATRPWRRRQVVGGIAASSVIVLAGAAGLMVLGRRRTPLPSGIALGVMPFRSVADDPAHAGLRVALRDGLNSRLRLHGGVKVYSRELLDFLVPREGLTEYEAATRLGIRKALSGTDSAKGDDVRVEVQIVDIATGTLDSSFVVVGSDTALIELESDVARAVIGKLGVELTGADTRRLEGFRATDVSAYRRFLATEGESTRPAPGPPTTPPADGPSSWLLPRSAWAEDTTSRDEVLAFLERYRKAIEARDLDTLADLYVEFPPEQRAALVHYFKDSADLRGKAEDVDGAIAGDEANVGYTRKDEFGDAPTGRPMHVSGRVTKLLRRAGGRWQLAPGK